MSILIKGMTMPQGCFSTDGICFAHDGVECHCRLAPDKIIHFSARVKNERPSWCPLIELPPHGDLIDKRMLINDISSNAFANADVDCKEEYDFWNRVWEYIRKIPVVIESEET